MRDHLFNPTEGDPRLENALRLANDIYCLFEAGSDYAANLRELGLISGRPIHLFEVEAAFGSISPETFARKQLIDWHSLPTDVTDAELLEMAEHVADVTGDDFQTEYWLACLSLNTGDERISDLFFWPGEYFKDGNDDRCLSPAEILATAFASSGKRPGSQL